MNATTPPAAGSGRVPNECTGPRALLEHLDVVLATAARAPSVHNTQPWLFRTVGAGLELRADQRRRLDGVDPDGREMLISCGAALFGLRLAIRGLGHRPVVHLLPDLEQPDLLARIGVGTPDPAGPGDLQLLAGLRRRHTHRGAFTAEPLPPGLAAALQCDAEAEGATLVTVDGAGPLGLLAALVAAVDRRPRDPDDAAEVAAWTRPRGSEARDGVPAVAFPGHLEPGAGRSGERLPQRDFDLGRGWGTLDDDASTGSPVLTTAVLITAGDTPLDWLHAGQALHRLTLRAASRWVFASLYTRPLESPPIRAAIRAQLGLPGAPQMLLQLGRAGIAPLTARRPVDDVLTDS